MFYIYDVKRAETIKKVYESNSINDVDPKDIEMAFNCYPYYVNYQKYKDPSDEAWKRFEEYFIPKVEKGDLDASSRRDVAVACWFKVFKELFDSEYFEERLEYHKTHDDNECLFEYMHKLDVAQLKEFLPIFMGAEYVFSRREKEFKVVWEKLNQACLEQDMNAYTTEDIYNQYGCFNEKNTLYFFDYLEKESVVNIICNNIRDENKYSAALLALVMYTEGIEEVKDTLSRWRCDC